MQKKIRVEFGVEVVNLCGISLDLNAGLEVVRVFGNNIELNFSITKII